MLSGEGQLESLAAHIEIGIAPAVEFTGTAQGLARAAGVGVLAGVMNQEDSEAKAPLQFPKVGQQCGDLGRVVLISCDHRRYRQGGKVKPLTLSAREFLRRFTMHILPAGLVRIRHYGILANNRRQRDIPRARVLLDRRPRPAAKQLAQPTPPQPMLCPHCGQSGLRWVGFIDAQGRTHLKTGAAALDSS